MRARDGAVDKEEEKKKREPGAVFPNKTIVPKAKKKRPRPTESVAIVVIFFSICFFFLLFNETENAIRSDCQSLG